MANFLIVEDDEELRFNMVALLNHHGHSVIDCEDGKSAWEMLDQRSFDVLILDWDLPDTTAVEICQSYRKSGGEGAVLILTGRSRTQDKVEGLRSGADDYLTKPFDVPELLARLEALLRRSRSGLEEKLEDMVGKIFMEKYKILSVLGQGGMGMVYKAQHTKLERIHAIKVMNNTHGLQGGARKRFEQEARAMSVLNHENLVSISDFGLSLKGYPYIVMELLEGHTLQEELDNNGPISPARAVPIFVQIADAIGHAHERGIIHRDLKPSNVMLINRGSETDTERVKIVDLGLAKFTRQAEEFSQNLTHDGEIFGSPFYMSPEQATGGQVDVRCDIYSVGCLMFQALTGEVPMKGSTFIETITKRLTTEPLGIRDTHPNKQFPKSLDQIILKAMAREKANRFTSMAELKEQLITAKLTDGGFLSGIQAMFKRKK